jgi:hypothetical protein
MRHLEIHGQSFARRWKAPSGKIVAPGKNATTRWRLKKQCTTVTSKGRRGNGRLGGRRAAYGPRLLPAKELVWA